jgi:hypothetical protein
MEITTLKGAKMSVFVVCAQVCLVQDEKGHPEYGRNIKTTSWEKIVPALQHVPPVGSHMCVPGWLDDVDGFEVERVFYEGEKDRWLIFTSDRIGQSEGDPDERDNDRRHLWTQVIENLKANGWVQDL